MFNLYVGSPAFALPSLDAECIAAIAYLKELFHDRAEQWTVVEAHDPSTSPTGSFPLLHNVSNGDRIGGFSAITTYLSSLGYNLDVHLSLRQTADCSALKAHITNHAPPLISSHLYTSSSSYSNLTHPAVTRSLPHHALSYTIPSSLRTRATSLAASAGLDASFSTPATTGDTGVSDADAADKALASSSSPSLVFKRKQTVAAALRGEEGKLRFRVEAALDALLEPLEKILNQDGQRGKEKDIRGQRYLITRDTATSTDCLALGYLALLLYPEASDTFLIDSMKKRYPAVVQYTKWTRSKFISDSDDITTQRQDASMSTITAVAQAARHALHSTLLSHNFIAPAYILTNTCSPFTADKTRPSSLPLLPTTRLIATLLAPLLTLPFVLGLGYTTRTLWQGIFYDAWYWWRGYSFDYFDPWGGWQGWGGGEDTKVFERPPTHGGLDESLPYL